MEYTDFGRTGLRVSVAGLGCGGNSRLGLGRGRSEADAVALIRAAHDLGVNLIDTAEVYGTEGVVGEAVRQIGRDKLVIASKASLRIGGDLIDGAALEKKLEASLARLGTDYIDIYQLHAIGPAIYDHCVGHLVPVLLRAKEAGKIRHIGLTETSPNDPEQKMLQRALHDPWWESAMFAFSMLHQGARRDVFPLTQTNGVGTLLMFVVRNIFSQPGALTAAVRDLCAEGRLPPELADDPAPLDFLIHADGAVQAFGDGDYGQLVLGETADRLVPAPIPALPPSPRAVASSMFPAWSARSSSWAPRKRRNSGSGDCFQ